MNPLAILTPYQARWIEDRSEVKVCEKSRRIGLSWAEAADCTITAATSGRGGNDVSYVGYNKEMAREFIDDCAFWAKRIHRAAVAIDEEVIQDADRDIHVYRIDFASGHKIQALSSRPSNFRSREGVAVIDEAAFHDDLPELLKAAMAFLMWGGAVRVISTHDGEGNAFNELVTDIRAGRVPYSLHRIDFDQACFDGLYHKICERQGRAWTVEGENAWREKIVSFYRDNKDEELYCIPRQGGGAYLPSALIEQRMREDVPIVRWRCPSDLMLRSEDERRSAALDFCIEHISPVLDRLDRRLMTFFGEDFGRTGDLTVIWPIQMGQGLVRRTPFMVELSNVPFEQQKQVLFYIVDSLPRFTAGAMDARGNGQYLAEQAMLRYGMRVEQVMLSVEWYRENMPRYKAAFEDALIELPRDADILADHRMLKMDKGVAYIPEKRERGKSGLQRHGDSAIAGALAWYASTLDPPSCIGYQPVPRGRSMDEGGGWRDPFSRPDHSSDRDSAQSRLRANKGAW